MADVTADTVDEGLENVDMKVSGVNTDFEKLRAVDSFNALLNGNIQEFLDNTDTYVLVGIFVAVFTVMLTIVILALRSGSSRRRSILLLGLSDSGKTLLFSKLVHRRHFATQASIKENIADYNAEGKLKQSVKFIDIPGNEKLRHQYLEKFKAGARGIIFVIDSLTLQKEIKDVAEFLYTLLTDGSLNKVAPSLLIACNKQDQALAKGAKLIQSLLEKELNAARISKSASLSETDGSGRAGVIYLGKPNQDFSFSDARQFRVEFIECSARGSSKEEDCSGLSGVEEWIARVA